MPAPALSLLDRPEAVRPSPPALTLVAEAAALRRRVRLLEAELAQQAHLLEARSRFLTQMSQELRTPVNGLVGMAQLLTGTPLNAEQGEIVHMLAESAEGVLNVINDVLDFSRIEAGHLRLDVARFELASVVESVFEMVSPLAAEKNLRLAYLAAPDLPDFFEGDASRMRQVLLNLVANAVAFTFEGDVTVRARAEPLGSHTSRVRLSLAVSDTGVGIEARHLAALFNPYAERPAAHRLRGGVGLGLAIAQRLTTLMQGVLSATSTPGTGSTFIFNAPLAVSFPARSTPPCVLSGKRVLVAEPHAPSLEMMSTILTRTGVTVLPAASVDDALRVLDDGAVDAAFYSATLSDRTGTRLLLRARQHAHGAHLPALELHPLGQRPPGTTVLTLTTPVQREAVYQAAHELLHAMQAPDGNAGGAAPGSQQAGRAASELRILLAEDNPINQMVALRLLDSLGYRADVVENGLEAVEAVQRRPYDVVLMDVMMPVMDGLEATRRIRQALGGDQPRIIAVTANALASDRQRCLEAGMDEHIPKPLRVEVLAQALRRFGGSAAPAEAAAAPSTPPADPDARLDAGQLRELRASLGDDDPAFFQELVDDFLADSVVLLEQLTAALDASDAPTVRRAVHTLKSSAAMFGATQLSDVARRAELAAKEEDLDTVRALSGELQEHFVAVEAELERRSQNGFAGL